MYRDFMEEAILSSVLTLIYYFLNLYASYRAVKENPTSLGTKLSQYFVLHSLKQITIWKQLWE